MVGNRRTHGVDTAEWVAVRDAVTFPRPDRDTPERVRHAHFGGGSNSREILVEVREQHVVRRPFGHGVAGR